MVVVSPHRASSEEIEELQQYDRLMAQLTGANTHRVVASVATDRRAREVLEDGGPTGTRSCRRRLTMRVSSGGSDAPSGTGCGESGGSRRASGPRIRADRGSFNVEVENVEADATMQALTQWWLTSTSARLRDVRVSHYFSPRVVHLLAAFYR